MEKFCALFDNDVSLQQIFIKLMKESQTDHTRVFIGVSHSEDETMRIGIVNGSCYVVQLLQSSHEEADDRMFHLNHADKLSKFCSVAIASPDTNIFVCPLYHFSQFVYFGLNEFWFVSGRSNSLTIVPIHDLVEKMSANIIGILPAVHVLTGCDTTSKIGRKAAALKTANACGCS